MRQKHSRKRNKAYTDSDDSKYIDPISDVDFRAVPEAYALVEEERQMTATDKRSYWEMVGNQQRRRMVVVQRLVELGFSGQQSLDTIAQIEALPIEEPSVAGLVGIIEQTEFAEAYEQKKFNEAYVQATTEWLRQIFGGDLPDLLVPLSDTNTTTQVTPQRTRQQKTETPASRIVTLTSGQQTQVSYLHSILTQRMSRLRQEELEDELYELEDRFVLEELRSRRNGHNGTNRTANEQIRRITSDFASYGRSRGLYFNWRLANLEHALKQSRSLTSESTKSAFSRALLSAYGSTRSLWIENPVLRHRFGMLFSLVSEYVPGVYNPLPEDSIHETGKVKSQTTNQLERQFRARKYSPETASQPDNLRIPRSYVNSNAKLVNLPTPPVPSMTGPLGLPNL